MDPVEARFQAIANANKGHIKCRIPQRLPTRKTPVMRPKTTQDNSVVSYRPKSAGRTKDENKLVHGVQRTTRTEKPMLKRPVTANRGGRVTGVIMVPTQKLQGKSVYTSKNVNLPDQATIQKLEELELEHSDFSNHTRSAFNDLDSLTSRSDKMIKLKINWQEKITDFEKMKCELADRQRMLLELYANMRVTHKKMLECGQAAALPPADDLNIMNVSELTPVQLLELCETSRQSDRKMQENQNLSKKHTIYVNKMYNMPSKLVATCEQTLNKRKDIIDWFTTLTREKAVSMNELSRKINVFYSENCTLNESLQKVKTEYYTELNEIVEILRNSVNETMAMRLNTEEMMNKITELTSQNEDLTKRLHNVEHTRSQNNKYKYEELERELKEEKAKKTIMKERLAKTEGQMKTSNERNFQLDAALEQLRLQNRNLERTVQQLDEQNKKLQIDFNKELNTLTDSIKENTMRLKEIADSREKLQAEKQDLENRFETLSEQYNSTIKELQTEMNVKGNDTEKKFIEEKKKLEDNVASLCIQLQESEIIYKDIFKQLQDSEIQLNKTKQYETELESAKNDINKANVEIEEYKNRLLQQSEAINKIECDIKDAVNLEKSLKCDLNDKDEYIAVLEKKQFLIEQRLEESEALLKSHEEVMTLLKCDMNLQGNFGKFENFNDLRVMIHDQQIKALETKRQHEELTKLLQSKEMDLETYTEKLQEHESLLEQRNGVIKVLSEKEEEHANIIKLLRNNLEMRSKADSDLNQQLSDKNTEIETLLTTLEARKKQISELEKIIVTLEDQTCKGNEQITQLEKIILSLEEQARKSNQEKRKYRDQLHTLESKVQEYELCPIDKKRSIGSSTDNLDNLIKILENELGMPSEIQKDQSYATKGKYFGSRNKSPNNSEYQDGQPLYHSKPDAMPTKIVMGNFVKKTYMPTNEEQKGDNLDHTKAIPNIVPQDWICPDVNMYDSSSGNKDNFPPYRVMIPLGTSKENYLSRNLRLLISDPLRDDKKMFKFAGHRL